MRKNINTTHLEGYVYQHSLVVKQVQNQESENFGKDFISGEIEIAVDEDCLNVVPVHFTYVTETTSKGNKNATYAALQKIINDNQTVVTVGKDNAQKVKVDTALALNEFYNNEDTLVSTKRNEGGFVTLVNKIDEEIKRNTFTADMVITSVNHVDADEEKNITEHVEIRGAIFDFKNSILPVDFSVENAAGIKYFESLEVSGSEPLYTKVWGKIICKTITRTVTEETAFGEPAVKSYQNKSKAWIVTGTSKTPYEFGEEGVLTVAELQEAVQNRQVYLAGVKKRAEDYKANRNNPTAATPKATTAKKGSFIGF